MAQSRGKARRAQKQKKRREGRRKQRAARRIHQPARSSHGGAAASDGEPAQRERKAIAGLTAEQLERIGYDPQTGPEPEAWLLLDEGERMENIRCYHSEVLPKDALPPNLALHVSMHVVVENQLAGDDPIEARPALQRVMDDGASRHDAIHALGWLVMRYIRRAMTDPTGMDTASYRKELGALTLQRWLDMASD